MTQKRKEELKEALPILKDAYDIIEAVFSDEESAYIDTPRSFTIPTVKKWKTP